MNYLTPGRGYMWRGTRPSLTEYFDLVDEEVAAFKS